MKYACENCIACGKCTETCPAEAIRIVGRYYTVEEIIEEVLKDTVFFRTDEGGITLSGGEPLLQWRFAGDVLEAAKAEYIHTAVETSGFAPWEHLEYVARRCDLLLFDVKALDSGLHERYTGKSNDVILRGLRRVSGIVETIARLPIIGGINDGEDLAEKTLQFLKSTEVKRVDLLPYHMFGRSKYDMIGKPYECEGSIPSTEKLEALKKIYERGGLKAEVF
jgi:pyruvate formate lyase activating enzyme